MEYDYHLNRGTLDHVRVKPERKVVATLLKVIGFVALTIGIAIAVLLFGSLVTGSP